ncbi:MAG TPA: winged helix-turn-helix domain-containing protein [Terriglobia bacterium]|nr:winged helix-turn-helix domain-containing protein [Terriglobia bacterium]
MEGVTKPVQPTRSARFGAFELDLKAGELRKNKRKIALQNQPFQILVLLLEGAGEVVTREEIQKKLWSEDTIVEFGHSVDTAIKKLRQALGDDADEPHYIETLPRRGYRWLVPVEWVEKSAAGFKSMTPASSQARAGALGESHAAVVARTPVRDAVEEGPPWYSRASRRGALIAVVCVALGLGLVVAFGSRTFKTWFQGPAAAPQIHSLAVLPLENLSGDPNQEYFADGMTEALITSLGQVSALRVISRTSVMGYKGTKKRLPEIAHELGVDGVAEGSVLREGNRVRIIVQLVAIANGAERHLWARSYDRDLTNVLTLQGEVAQAIADEITIAVTPQEQARLARARQVNPEAQELYLQGMYLLNRGDPGFAVSYLQRASDKDPSYAPAYAALAGCYNGLGIAGRLPYFEAYSKAKVAAAKALEIDDDLADGHAELADALIGLNWDWGTAERELKRALEINPNSASVHRSYAGYLEAIGRPTEAIAQTELLLQLDPVSPVSRAAVVGFYYGARRYDQALAQARRALELDPGAIPPFELAVIWVEKGMYQEAIRAFQKLGDHPHVLGHMGNACARAGRVTEARSAVAKLKEHVQIDGLGTYEIALAYAWLGEKDAAFAWLERAYAVRDKGLTSIKIDPCLDLLRSEPRFRDLVRRVGLPP